VYVDAMGLAITALKQVREYQDRRINTRVEIGQRAFINDNIPATVISLEITKNSEDGEQELTIGAEYLHPLKAHMLTVKRTTVQLAGFEMVRDIPAGERPVVKPGWTITFREHVPLRAYQGLLWTMGYQPQGRVRGSVRKAERVTIESKPGKEVA